MEEIKEAEEIENKLEEKEVKNLEIKPEVH